MSETRNFQLLASVTFDAASKEEALRLLSRHFKVLADQADVDECISFHRGGTLSLEPTVEIGPSKWESGKALVNVGLCLLDRDEKGNYLTMVQTPITLMLDPDKLVDFLIARQGFNSDSFFRIVQQVREELNDEGVLETALITLANELMRRRGRTGLAGFKEELRHVR